jgi:ABC-type transport system involved in multi-copper enzyme maturation permease subunit
MPIHDQGYRHYGGTKARGRAWLVIFTAGFFGMFRNRKWIVLMIASWIQFIVRAVQFYIAANFSQAAVVAPSAQTFRDFFDYQNIFVFLVTVTLGAVSIADDRRANALQIYLSKPLTRPEYICGKLSVLMAFLLFITWLPAVLLLVVEIAFAGNFTFLTANLYLIPAITVYSLVEVLLVSMCILALSSLSTNSRFVGILFTALIFFSDALYGVMRAVTGGTSVSWIAFGNNLAQLGDVIFRVPLRYETPWPVSLAVVAGLIGVSAWILERRIRGVEIVA